MDNKPFLILGGELYNSSSSGLKYMDTTWTKLAKMNLNTVLAGVCWDLVEPAEGKFDFTLVDSLLQNAQKHHMKLVLLWFGSWKNGMSHYVPEWVKKDTKRFPRIQLSNGRHIEALSPFYPENLKADAKAFAALMKHIREKDSRKHTVIMMQVENEVGLIGDTRDHSSAANNTFLGVVPLPFMSYLQKNKATLLPSIANKINTSLLENRLGNWELLFGKSPATDEMFMAYNYAQYVNQVAAAGKKEYPIPMYVNAWIVQPQDKKPGDYPSGGPQSHLHDVWKAGAPNIDLFEPDIYLPDFNKITEMYHRNNNQLFIPESFAGSIGAANAFYVIGQLNAIGYSPFGIEDREPVPGKGPISKAYNVLNQLSPLILAAQGRGNIAAVSLNKADSVQYIEMGNYKLQVNLRYNNRSKENPEMGYGIIIGINFDEYVIAGSDIEVTFTTSNPQLPTVGL
ncbi:MAG: DUF5597 domain-containing protein, partial [Bacteroidota bacterium]|nr:DUF5597 domain-containing protein [Bacteroidota bacterium]